VINTQKDIQKRLRDTYRIKNIKKYIIKILKKKPVIIKPNTIKIM
jgi:hypothetical protein